MDGPPQDDEGLGMIRHWGEEGYEFEVDFAGLARSFLSTFWFQESGHLSLEEAEIAGPLIGRFLEYLLRHHVCPEYEADILEALGIAHAAAQQLPLCRRIHLSLQSQRDRAYSAMWGGKLQGQLDEHGGFLPLERREALFNLTRAEMLSLCQEYEGEGEGEGEGGGKIIQVGEVLLQLTGGLSDSLIEGVILLSDDPHIIGHAIHLHLSPQAKPILPPHLKGLLIEVDLARLGEETHIVERVLGVWPSYTERALQGWISKADSSHGW
jgi:hypothetical protein